MIKIVDCYDNVFDGGSNFKINNEGYANVLQVASADNFEGELRLGQPVLASSSIVVSGDIFGETSDQTLDQLYTLSEMINNSPIKVYDGDYYYEGDVENFSHQQSNYLGKLVLKVSFTLKCYKSVKYAETDMVIHFTPETFPNVMECEAPLPLVNFSLGHYDAVTGAYLYQKSDWIFNTTYPGYSGDGYLLTSTVGNGFEFDCVNGFSLIGAPNPGGKVKLYVDDIYIKEYTYTSSGVVFGEVLSYTFDDLKLHRVKIINTFSSCRIDKLKLSSTHVADFAINTRKSIYAEINASAYQQKRILYPLGKVQGDATHPYVIRYGAANSLSSINLTGGTELTTSLYRTTGIQGLSVAYAQTDVNGNFPYFLIEVNLMASKCGYGAISIADLLNSFLWLTPICYGYGYGANAGVSENGIELYVKQASTSTWVKLREVVNSQITIITYAFNSGFETYINSSGVVYFLIKPKYSSNGTIISRIELDSFWLNTINHSIKFSNNFITLQTKNLLPNFNDDVWTLDSNAIVLSDYKLRSTANGVALNNECLIDIVGGETYTTWVTTTNGLMSIFFYDSAGVALAGTSIDNITQSTFTAPLEARTAVFRLHNPTGESGTYIFDNPCLTVGTSRGLNNHQCEYTFGLNVTKTLKSSDSLYLDTKQRYAYFNTDSVYNNTNDEFKYDSMQLDKHNRMTLNYSGDGVEVNLKYRGEWR